MKLMISGSREAKQLQDVQKLYDAIHAQRPTMILHGGAQGADQIAKNYATENGLSQTEIKPNYEKYGKNATHIRNNELLQLSDKVICYYATTYPTKTAGTASVAEKARKQGKLIAELWRSGEATETQKSLW